LKLFRRNLDYLVEQAERWEKEAQKRTRAEDKKRIDAAKARREAAIAANNTPEAKRKRFEEHQAGDLTTGRRELQERNRCRHGTRK